LGVEEIMCGIFGSTKLEVNVLKTMSKNLKHRGPEKTYYWGDKAFYIGINRLATIGKQVEYPLNCNMYHLVFNGDVYNYKEIHKDLTDRGYKQKTDTDGEVIVAGYYHFGEAIFEKIIGQFAVIIYDESRKQLILARDAFGICPLYYTIYDNNIYVGSELKTFKGIIPFNLDRSMLQLYYNFDCVPAPYTLIKGIYKLEPGTILVFQLPGEDNRKAELIKKHTFWQLEFNKTHYDYSPLVVSQQIEKAITYGTIADYPVAAYLSGGMDSSTIVSVMSKLNKKLHTFSVHFSDSNVKDESEDAKRVADYFKTIHHSVIVGPDVIKQLPEIVYAMDEPTPNITALAQYKLSELVNQTNIKIVVDGSGGDELFGGYTFQNRIIPIGTKLSALSKTKPIMAKLQSLVENRKIKKGLNIIPNFGNTKMLYNSLVHSGMELSEDRDIYSDYDLFNDAEVDDIVNQVIEADIKITLSNQYLHLSDRMAMAHSVVSRCPYLTKELAKYALSIPVIQKDDKSLMRKSMQGKLPPKTIAKGKAGFVAPLTDWWPEISKQYLQRYTHTTDIKKEWQMLILEIWAKQMVVYG
jgi:asparagine synthase (glutamine-hydrolysing)